MDIVPSKQQCRVVCKKPLSLGFLPHLLGIILPEFGPQIPRIFEDVEYIKFRFIGNFSDAKLGSPSNLECSLANSVRIMPSRGD